MEYNSNEGNCNLKMKQSFIACLLKPRMISPMKIVVDLINGLHKSLTFQSPYGLQWLITTCLSSNILQFYWQHFVISMSTNWIQFVGKKQFTEKAIAHRYVSENNRDIIPATGQISKVPKGNHRSVNWLHFRVFFLFSSIPTFACSISNNTYCHKCVCIKLVNYQLSTLV